MRCSLPYANEEIHFSIPDEHALGILEPTSADPCADVSRSARVSIEKPIAGPSLREILRTKHPGSVVIIVNDLTRSTPTQKLLPPILTVLEEEKIFPEQITIVIATGTHRPLNQYEMEQVVGREVKERYAVVNHDCDAFDLVSFRKLPSGNELLINKFVAEAGVRISVGEVLFHYYAGYSGGRKSVLPGVAGRECIMKNHFRMLDPGASIGRLDGNPVHEEMLEALVRCPLDFIVNVVCDSHKHVVRIVAGHPIEAWLDGIQTFEKMNTSIITRRAEVVFASAGGFPKDTNLFQSHKAMEMASRALVDGGTLVLFAECGEGLGHPVFAEWAARGLSEQQVTELIKAEFRFGGHKLFFLAQLAKRVRLILYTSLDEKNCKNVFCSKVSSLERLFESFYGRYGRNFKVFAIPQGGIVLPKYQPI